MGSDAEGCPGGHAGVEAAAAWPQRRRQSPTRPAAAPTHRPTEPLPKGLEGELRRLHGIVRRLEHKVDAQACALARFQRQHDASHAAELFRRALAASFVNAAPCVLNGDPFGAIAQVIPVVQNLKGGAESFTRSPLSTLAVPAIALGIYALRQPRKPVIVTHRLRTARPVRVTVISPDGGDVYFTTDGSEPTRSSQRYADHIAIEPYKADFTLRVRAFLLLRASETAEVKFTKPTWWERWILR